MLPWWMGLGRERLLFSATSLPRPMTDTQLVEERLVAAARAYLLRRDLSMPKANVFVGLRPLVETDGQQ